MKNSIETSRETVYAHTLITHTSTKNSQNMPARVFLNLIALPAVLCGCSPEEAAPEAAAKVTAVTAVRSPGASVARTLDIFTFNDDALQRLDSYMRIEDFVQSSVDVASQAGDKIMFFCANGQRGKYSWADVNCVASLDGICVRLEEEDPRCPVMTACCRTSAGRSVEDEVELRPLMSCVMLNSVSCDFSGLAYEGATIKDAKVYLTNVNAGCSLTAEGRTLPQRIINAGMLREEDMEGFDMPEMVVRSIAPEIGTETLHSSVSLHCYPSMGETEGPGTPFTRMVIEGRVEGTTCYWPVTVNRTGGEEDGIGRNRLYIYDIVIRRKGSADPDTPVNISQAEFSMKTRPWNEKEEYRVTF